MIRVIAASVVLLGVIPGLADEPAAKPFNGRDLNGWTDSDSCPTKPAT